MNLLVWAAAVVVLLGALILVHELGHFVCAKLFDVKVIRFSLGFGPRVLGVTWGETEYRLSLIPLGGFVRLLGENPAEPWRLGIGTGRWSPSRCGSATPS